MKVSFRAVAGAEKRKQGLVYYAMMNRRHSAPHVIKACEDALDKVCKSDYDKKMMTEYVSTEASTVFISTKYYCSVDKVQRLFRKYMIEAVRSITNV